MARIVLLALAGLLLTAPALAETAPTAWVDAARALPIQAGRLMPLETWARLQGVELERLLTSWVADPGRFDPKLWGSELPDSTRETAAALFLYWADRSQKGDWTEAAQSMDALTSTLAAAHGPLPVTAIEVFWGRFPWLMLVSILAGLGVLARISRQPAGGALVAAALTALVLTLALTVRIVLTGRPPITNLADTFLFVAWLMSVVGVFLAMRPQQTIAFVVATVVGGVLPWLGPLTQTSADPYAPVAAVLNTGFWLAVHVPTIASGYTAALLAGILGHAYLVVAGGKHGGASLTPIWKALRVALLVALALTAAGTLLGGIWADQSWGRFWGWDPKENGALLLILWLAVTLHLKPSGWVAEWGTALAAALLIPVLLFSWLGVNLLGQGLHTYGATPGKQLLFLSLLATDTLVLSWLIVRRSLR